MKVSLLLEPMQVKNMDELSLQFSSMVADVADILQKSQLDVLDKLKLICYSITTREKLLNEKEKAAIRASHSVFDIFYDLRGHWRAHLLFALIKRSESQEALKRYEQFQNLQNYTKN